LFNNNNKVRAFKILAFHSREQKLYLIFPELDSQQG